MAATLALAADSMNVRALAAGVTYVFAHLGSGPFAIHGLEIDRRVCGPVLRAVKAGPPLVARATTSALSGGLGAINADFFEIPAGRTVGAHVNGGAVLVGPDPSRPAFAVTAAGYHAGAVRLDGWIAAGSDTVRLDQVNRPGEGPTLFTHWAGAVVTDRAVPAVVARVLAGGAGIAGRGVILAGVARDTLVLEPGAIALLQGGAWSERRAAGDTVMWHVRMRTADGQDAQEVVGGFPVLRAGGRDVLAAQPDVRPSFGAQRHPRTAIGWSPDRLWWIVVDGRQTPWSDGMTLAELADLFGRLGADDAINLDGGGSSALVLAGRIANRPSDAQGERAVGNALVLERCAAARESLDHGGTASWPF